MFYQTTFTPPQQWRAEDWAYWAGLAMAQASVVVLALLRRRGLR